MKRTKLLLENRARAYRDANEATRMARAQLDALVPCDCGQALIHTRECSRWKVGAAIVAVYNAAHRAGQCREREKVAKKLRGRVSIPAALARPSSFAAGIVAALEDVERMRYPK